MVHRQNIGGYLRDTDTDTWQSWCTLFGGILGLFIREPWWVVLVRHEYLDIYLSDLYSFCICLKRSYIRKVVAQWLGTCLWCLRSQVRFPLAARKISVSEHTFSSVICRDDARSVHRPSDRDVKWMSPVRGKSLPVQVKQPYSNLDMVTCRLSSCNPECTKYNC